MLTMGLIRNLGLGLFILFLIVAPISVEAQERPMTAREKCFALRAVHNESGRLWWFYEWKFEQVQDPSSAEAQESQNEIKQAEKLSASAARAEKELGCSDLGIDGYLTQVQGGLVHMDWDSFRQGKRVPPACKNLHLCSFDPNE
jgi:hypothetical protein